MTAPVATVAQLVPTVERALRKSRGRRRVVLVRAAPDAAGIAEVQVGADRAHIRASSSPLEIRALVGAHDAASGVLVVLTDCERKTLGDDLLARVAGRDIVPLDRWQSIKDLFGVTDIAADLGKKRELADALIEARPLDGYPPVRTKVLNADLALAALLQAYLELSPDVATLAGLVEWGMRPDAANRINRLDPGVLADVRRFLTERFGPGAEALLAVVSGGRGADIVALGLVGGLVHHTAAGETGREAAVHLRYQVGGVQLAGDAWRALSGAVEALVGSWPDQATANGWRARAEALLAEVEATGLAYLSDELPAGFTQRLALAGAALAAWDAGVDNADLAAAAQVAVERVEAHRRRDDTRCLRLQMAARMIRRGTAPLPWGDRLPDAARTYQRDGAWLDAARVVVSRGEREPALAALYAQLTERFDRLRDDDNRRFAAVGATAAGAVPDPLVGVEQVLDRVVGPLRDAGVGVLVVVADGLGLPTWTELAGELAGYGWTPYRRPGAALEPVAVAVLPTVTEFSRTSLLCGTVRRGDGDSETRGFRDHPAVRRGGEPEGWLWHKKDLRVGGLDRVPDDLLDAVGDDRRRVVGVVLNNIDERLKDVALPPQGWGLAELDPLRWVLDAAAKAGRAVVLTADHGHLLERDGIQITDGAGGGERWRQAVRPAGDGEIEVSGPRVVPEGGNAILPWREAIRYGSRHNGYHGGLTPQELFVPLVVLAADDAVLPGWEPVAVAPPAWWHHRPAAPVVEVAALVLPSSKPTRPVKTEPTLFDLDTVTPPTTAAPVATGVDAWAADTTAALVRAGRRHGRIRLTDEQITQLLAVLAGLDGTPVSLTRLADLAALSAGRMRGYVAQLQELVNIEGYGILTLVGEDVRLDRALLDRQLGRG